jgi:Tol biopolymer transport system component
MLTIRSLARMLAYAALFPLAVACGHSDDGDEPGPERVPNQLQHEKIAYAHGQEIFILNPDGTGARQLTGNTETYESSPAWSRDGRLIAYVRTPRAPYEVDVPPGEEIHVMDADGTNVRRLTRNTAEERTPRWLPDGRIVFVFCPSSPPGTDERPECSLVAMRADGTGREELARLGSMAPLGSTAALGDVSPDGRRVVYAQIEGQSHYQESELYVMNIDGTGRRALTDNDTGDAAPAWSPDGQRIAFMSNRAESAPCDTHDCVGFKNELWVMNTDGSDVTRLTETPQEEFTPTWSTDGEKIVYSRERSDGPPELFVMNADGSCPRRLAEGTEPDWYGAASTDGQPLDTLKAFLNELRDVTC